MDKAEEMREISPIRSPQRPKGTNTSPIKAKVESFSPVRPKVESMSPQKYKVENMSPQKPKVESVSPIKSKISTGGSLKATRGLQSSAGTYVSRFSGNKKKSSFSTAPASASFYTSKFK